MKKNSLLIIPMVLLTFIMGFGLSQTLNILFSQTNENVEPSVIPSTTKANRHFFSEDIVLYGTDDQGEPFFLKLNLNRKQEGENRYIHYYFGNLIYGKTNITDYIDFHKDAPIVPAEKWFTSYNHQHSTDLSPREKYHFTLNLKGNTVKVSIQDLEGDFLIRNRLEYSKYASIGKAKVQIGKTDISAEAFVTTIYSENYEKLIFFDGYDKVQPLTDYLIFWDEKGSFYLIDHSVVEPKNPYYPSHTWLLYKDGTEGWAKKGFEITSELEKQNNIPKQWNIQIPFLKAEVSLETIKFFEKSTSEGIASGNIKTPQGTYKIQGFFERHE